MAVCRIGFGTDRHRLGPGDGLRVGGVTVPAAQRALAHSDGDVLLHALTDALLGAIAAGDIGTLFPDDREENRDRDSADFVQAAWARVRDAGLVLGNLDMVVHLQQPRLSPHRPAIVARVAELLDADPARVSFKAKSGEGVGPVGTGAVETPTLCHETYVETTNHETS